MTGTWTVRSVANGELAQVTLVTPVYNEEESLRLYANAVRAEVFPAAGVQFEVLFVDDGSTDRSWGIIQEICASDRRFRGLRLSRNFGAHTALSAGIDEAKGDAVATLACDLQDSPRIILDFIERWRCGAKIVWGRRRTRRDERWKVWTSGLFFRLVKRYAMPRGSRFSTGSFFLIDRSVADCFRQFRERNRITFALVAWTGFEQDVVEYDRRARVAGNSGWTLGRMIRAMYDTFIGFSDLLPRLITLVGAATFVFSILFSIYLVVSATFFTRLPGWTTIMLAIAILFGMLFLALGIMSEYLYRIYSEVVARPLYFISERVGDAEQSAAPEQ